VDLRKRDQTRPGGTLACPEHRRGGSIWEPDSLWDEMWSPDLPCLPLDPAGDEAIDRHRFTAGDAATRVSTGKATYGLTTCVIAAYFAGR
jgi:hypothetical protein